MKFAALVFIAVAAGPSIAQAQFESAPSWPPTAGSRIRLTAVPTGKERQTGTLISANSDSVTFRPATLNNSVAFRTADVTRLEVSHGTHTWRAKGAMLGFMIVGGITGAMTAATWDKEHAGFMDFGRWGDAAIVGGTLGVVGAIVGAIAGTHANETWHSVPLPRN